MYCQSGGSRHTVWGRKPNKYPQINVTMWQIVNPLVAGEWLTDELQELLELVFATKNVPIRVANRNPISWASYLLSHHCLSVTELGRGMLRLRFLFRCKCVVVRILHRNVSLLGRQPAHMVQMWYMLRGIWNVSQKLPIFHTTRCR